MTNKVLGIIFLILMVFQKNTKAEMQIIKYDVLDNSEGVDKKIEVAVNDNIDMSKYNGNDIIILDVTDEYVEISREVTRYDIINTETKEIRTYKENVVEKVKYGEKIQVNINDIKPFELAVSQARYYYKIEFVKL